MLALSACNPRSVKDRTSVWLRSYLSIPVPRRAALRRAARAGDVLGAAPPANARLHRANYYTRDFVRTPVHAAGNSSATCARSSIIRASATQRSGLEIYPEGSPGSSGGRALQAANLITENGVPGRHDEDRWIFISMHLWQVRARSATASG